MTYLTVLVPFIDFCHESTKGAIDRIHVKRENLLQRQRYIKALI